MTQTFKIDDSFFTVVMPTRCPIRFWDVFKWVEEDANAKFRFIRDFEIEQGRLPLREVEEIYPGVKTIGIVVNPWARAAWSYAMSIDPPEGYPGVEQIQKQFEGLDFSSFDSYINSILTCKSITNKHHPTVTQSSWLTHESRNVDFLLRAETVNQDFKQIQDYFCTDRPLGVEDFTFDYNPYYSNTSKQIIEEIFNEDIERYGYVF
jgi:hypothetical protein